MDGWMDGWMDDSIKSMNDWLDGMQKRYIFDMVMSSTPSLSSLLSSSSVIR